MSTWKKKLSFLPLSIKRYCCHHCNLVHVKLCALVRPLERNLLLVLLLCLHVEVAKLVGLLVGSDDAKEVAELLLLQVLLGEVLKKVSNWIIIEIWKQP